MNIKQAKELDLHIIVEAAGGVVDRNRSTPGQNSYFFKSCLPGRDEQTASLHVWKAPNGSWCWKDHGGDGKGGDIVSFGQAMSEGQTISDGLKWLDQFSDRQMAYKIHNKEHEFKRAHREVAPKMQKYTVAKSKHLFEKPYNKNLLAFINSRSVSPKILANYVREVHFTDERKKNLFGLGLRNESLGIEVRTALDAFPKCVIGDKDISIFDCPGLSKVVAHVFEGMFDFFTWLEIQGQHHAKHPPAPVVILNSSNMAARAAEVINSDDRFKATKSIVLWSQNDTAGEKATMVLAENLDTDRFTFGTMNHYYSDHKDLSEYWSSIPENERPRFAGKFRQTQSNEKISAYGEAIAYRNSLKSRKP